MPSIKLTAAAVERIKAPPTGRVEYFDAVLPAFGLRVTEKGHKSWIVMYRAEGRLRRLTLGSYPAVKLDKARDLAREAFESAAAGGDPAAERKRQRSEQPGTFKATAQTFIERYAKARQRSWRKTEQILNRDVVPAWGPRPIGSISRADVLELLDGIMDQGKPYMANRVLGHVRTLFNWAVARGLVEASPVAGIRAPGREVKRDRVLTEAEMRAVWAGCDNLGYPFGPLFKLLLATAQRRDEVATARWSDFDLKAGLWTLPREHTKSDRVHEVPLSKLAKDVVKAIPRFGDSQAEHLFTSGRCGDAPVSGYSKAKERLDAWLAEQVAEGALPAVARWRLHDLRRTAASGMAKLNVAPHVLSRILNHASDGTGVTAIYNRYAYEAEKRHALDCWGRYLAQVVKGKPVENVTPIRRASA